MELNKEINLIPVSKGPDLHNILHTAAIPASIVVFIGILVFTAIVQQLTIYGMNTELAKVKIEISAMNNLYENIKDVEGKQAELQDRKIVMSLVEKEKIKVLDFMNKLKLYIPVKVKIISLSITNGEKVNIKFETANTYDIASLIVMLKEMDTFEKVEIDSLPINDKKNVIAFDLKLKNINMQESAK